MEIMPKLLLASDAPHSTKNLPRVLHVRSVFAGVAVLIACIAAFVFILTWQKVEWLESLKAIWVLWAALVAYCCIRWREQIVTLFFLFTFFLFLLGRPFVRSLEGKKWWIGGVPATEFVLFLLFVALVSLGIGVVVFGTFIRFRSKSYSAPIISARRNFAISHQVHWFEEHRESNIRLKALSSVSLVVFVVSWLASAYLGYEKLAFMVGRSYTEYFLYFRETAPLVVRTLATFTEYALCMYLLTMPRKKSAYVVLTAYIALNIPTLIIGLRGRFIFSVIFAVIYFFLRARHESRDHWVGKFEKSALILGIPLAMFALNAVNYIRSGKVNLAGNFFGQISDFFDKQGVSFEVLSHGYYAVNKVIQFRNNYTFGPFVDFLTRDSYGRFFSGLEPLPGSNSQIMATQSHSFAHALSFFQHENYLGGEGYGSSYLLELFADYHWVGVVLGSFILALVLVAIPRLFDRGGIPGLIALCSLGSIFWMPRDSALGWLTFVVTIQFWLLVAIVYSASAIFSSARPYLTMRSYLSYQFDVSKRMIDSAAASRLRNFRSCRQEPTKITSAKYNEGEHCA